MLADGTRRRILATCALGAAPALAALAGAAFSPAAAAHAATTPDVRCVVWTSPSGDDTYLNSAIKGQNPQFDLIKGELDMSADGKTMKAFLTVSNLTLDTPHGLTAADWIMLWTFKDTRSGKDITYFAEANLNEVVPGSSTIQYFDGVLDANGHYTEENPTDTPDTGKTTLGANGVVEIDVPLANIGNPLPFTVLTKVTGETLAEESVSRYPSDTRYVMDTGGPVKDYVVAQGCGAGAAASGGHASRAATAAASSPHATSTAATVASSHGGIASSPSSIPQRSSGSAVTATQLRSNALAGAAVGRSDGASGAAAVAGLLFGGVAIRLLRRRRPALERR